MPATPRLKLTVSILIAIVISLMIGSFMTWAAWLHNPQAEFHDGSSIRYVDLSLVFGSWFMMTMGIASVFIIGGMLVRSWTRKREDR